jgi:hypothetical protein
LINSKSPKESNFDSGKLNDSTVVEGNEATANKVQGEENEDEDGNHLSGFALWLMAIALMLGVLVMALDNNIIGTGVLHSLSPNSIYF